jgi:alkylation response protein AidB-like acyl-CoA dehydrogenase
MDLELDDSQVALRDTVRHLLAARAPVRPYVRDHVEGLAWARDDVWVALSGIGAVGLPVADGDEPALGLVEAAVVAEEMGRALYPGPWAASAVGAVRALLAAPDPDTALLSTIADGSVVAAAVVPRPVAPAPTIVRTGEGLISGTVRGVLGAVSADVLLVVAQDETGALELATVHPGEHGVTVTTDTSVDRSTDIGTVTLEAAAAPAVGALTPAAVRAVGDALLVVTAADALGAATTVFELAVAYAKERQQFGQPIGAFQAVQHLCVDMLEAVELARGGVLAAAWALDQGDADEAHRAALRTKAFADRLATVGDTAIQVFGGIGFTWEHDSHLYLKRLLTWSAYLGSPAAYRRELGRSRRGLT